MYELIRVCGGKGNRGISEVFDISEYLGDFNFCFLVPLQLSCFQNDCLESLKVLEEKLQHPTPSPKENYGPSYGQLRVRESIL